MLYLHTYYDYVVIKTMRILFNNALLSQLFWWGNKFVSVNNVTLCCWQDIFGQMLLIVQGFV